MYANIVSTIALALSLASAAAAAYLYLRWNRPVLVVTGKQWITSAQQPSQRRAGFSIEITNVGNQPTQVLDAYWLVDRGDGMEMRFNAKHGGGGVESLFTSCPMSHTLSGRRDSNSRNSRGRRSMPESTFDTELVSGQ